ncbi:RloB family protein [Tenacibaculum finnmarkense genomovar ulcerans]|uniref:RloB family protein n=1 Tax=Tenacibaculum finnmarkense TaxID=2781243 RepID=UPI001E46CF80|nr:RloB family protein [Tenacibaculum finnmarkense]MCD8455226.1 RloB family protein [Tenacibaculum finnmarkense genomovar ulcerans]
MARKTNTRNTKFRVAIIGEGHTEWYYFSNMKQHERFKFKLEPELPKHSDYKTLIKSARKKRDEGYDLIFCVLDMDTILTNSTQKAGYLKEKSKTHSNKNIEFIESMPCIEFWFLQFFLSRYSSKLYLNYGQVVKELKKHFKQYEKTEKLLESIKLYEHLNNSGNFFNANKFSTESVIEKRSSTNSLYNYTQINELINKLKSI